MISVYSVFCVVRTHKEKTRYLDSQKQSKQRSPRGELGGKERDRKEGQEGELRGESAAMPAAAEPAYMEMTLEEYLMQYCEEHVRARRPRARFPASHRAAASDGNVCAAQVATIEQEAQTNATKLRCDTISRHAFGSCGVRR